MSRQRTNRPSFVDGRCRGSGGASPGWMIHRIFAPAATLAARIGAGMIGPPIITAGIGVGGARRRVGHQRFTDCHLPGRLARFGDRTVDGRARVVGEAVCIGDDVDDHRIAGSRPMAKQVSLSQRQVNR